VRRIAQALLGIALLAMAPPAKLMKWSDLTTRPHPHADKRVTYGRDPLQWADLWLPAGKGPFPTVLMIHGGCWQSSVAGADLMDWIADDLRKHNVAVWNIEYRGVDRPGGGYPGTFSDVANAADLLARDGGKYGLNTKRIVAVGHSAGGHLAMWLAARPRLKQSSELWNAHPAPIAAVVSQGGLPDLALARTDATAACGVDTVDRLIGQVRPEHPDPLADTSPDKLMPIGVPQTLVNGDQDHVAPPRFADAWLMKTKAAGDRAMSIKLPDQGHVELIAPETPAWAATRNTILRDLGLNAPQALQPRPR
jgi:acetyl esterase/lipase